MRLLVDTCVLLWAAGTPDRIPGEMRSRLEDEASTLYFSPASLWEIVIKRALGRDDFRVDPSRLRLMLVAHGWNELPISADHVLAVGALPALHRDPFDRVLLAQARSEGLQLLTVDARLHQYGAGVLSD